MKISIFGLGYVGSVSAACLAALGHHVVGVDPVESKVENINKSIAPVIEKDLDELIAKSTSEGLLVATTDATEAVAITDMSIICVGTPSLPNGDLDLTFIKSACEQIASGMARKSERHLIVVRSTVLPGTLRGTIIPILEKSSGKRAGIGFDICHHPEFLREGSAVADFFAPPKVVIGAIDPRVSAEVASIYSTLDLPLVFTSPEVSEMVKYADNVWHALKVGFANEIATFAKSAGVNSNEVMEIFCQDNKLNLSSAYLKPGFAFGGSCLPKDLRAVAARSRELKLELPVIESILISNARQIERGLELIMQVGKQPLAFLGISFKAGTDDLRESPLLALANRLYQVGYDIRIFDRNVSIANLVGTNREYLTKTAPYLGSLLSHSLEEALEHGQIVVVGNADREFINIADRIEPSQLVVDLIGIANSASLGNRYYGINW